MADKPQLNYEGFDATSVTSGLGQTATGAAGGAGAGAAIGSAVPGVGTAVGAVVGGGLGLFGKLFGKKSQKTEQGFTLPTEFEFGMIDQITSNLDAITADLEKITQLEQAYTAKIDILRKSIESTIPSDEVNKALMETNVQIAQTLGMSAQELAENGLLDADDVEAMEQLKALEDENFTDPQLEGQIADGKAQLEQELRRSGASAAVRAQALSEFERNAREERFGRAEQLRDSKFNRISGRIGVKQGMQQQNLGLVNNAFNTNRGLLADTRQGVGLLEGMANNQFTTQSTAMGIRSGLRGEAFQQYQNLGGAKLSKETQRAVKAGAVGPESQALKDFRASEEEKKKARDLNYWKQKYNLK